MVVLDASRWLCVSERVPTPQPLVVRESAELTSTLQKVPVWKLMLSDAVRGPGDDQAPAAAQQRPDVEQIQEVCWASGNSANEGHRGTKPRGSLELTWSRPNRRSKERGTNVMEGCARSNFKIWDRAERGQRLSGTNCMLGTHLALPSLSTR